MRRLNDFRFYELGTKLQPVAELTPTTPYKDVFYDMWFARAAVNEFLKSFPELSVCRNTANALVSEITSVVPNDWTEARAQDMDSAIGYQVYGLREAKETFEHVLSAELASIDTYLLTQQGIYSTADLVERADMAFGEATRNAISEEAKKDFKQGGRCLAFELPTASGFHTMRATEAVLRQYHAVVMKLAAGAKSPEMAQCINELRKAKEDPKLMSILDSIRDLHRNPQMHPEAFLTMDEALRLFDISKSAINAMADRLIALQPPVPAHDTIATLMAQVPASSTPKPAPAVPAGGASPATSSPAANTTIP